MARFMRSKALRNALWLAAGGRCQRCGRPLPPDWHADHVIPWNSVERTNVHEMQALCPECNLKKGATVLRKHQSDLLRHLQQARLADLLAANSLTAHVWPGGGKSALPVIAGHVLLAKGIASKIVVVVPRLSLKRQGAEAFLDQRFRSVLGHALEIREAGNDVNPDRGTAGYITTYDAIRESPSLHEEFFKAGKCLLVLDEVHHVADPSPTFNALKPLHARAAFRLYMTGSLDRNDGARIAFLDYSHSPADGKYYPVTNISYGLSDSIAEQATIQMEFHNVDGEVMYVDKFGQQVWLGTLTADNGDSRDGVHAALRTEYATQLLSKCVQHWRRWRLDHPRSLMLVVCADIKSAKAVQATLRGMDVECAIATSDDAPAAQEAIKRFRQSGTPAVLVTVAMAYEGMDVRPITHIACLTHIRSFPWLMQMFSRSSRFDPDAGTWRSQKAFVFGPDDAEMQKAIQYVREEQLIGIAQQAEDETPGGPPGDFDPPPTAPIHPGVVPVSGSTTRERVSGMWEEEDLTYDDTAKLKTLMDRHNVSGSVIDVASMLRDLGVDLDLVQSPTPKAARPPDSTVGDRETALRSSIEGLLRRLDVHTKSEFGTWNRKCFFEAQRQRRRETLAEKDLLYVWTWACEQAGKLGLEA